MFTHMAACILAGGQARRFGGGDKMLTPLGGVTLLERILTVLRPHAAAIALNINGDPDRLAGCALPLLPDSAPGHLGPLAGLLTALEWASTQPNIRWLLTVPGDTPFLPADLPARLWQAIEDGAPAAIAASGGRSHPVIGLWPVRDWQALRHLLLVEEKRRASLWGERLGAVTVEWPAAPVDPFFNLNSPEDLQQAQALLPLSPLLPFLG